MRKMLANLMNRATTRPSFTSDSPIASVSDNQDANCESVSEEAIRLRAYQKWEAAGKPDGDGRRFWLEAVHEVLQSK